MTSRNGNRMNLTEIDNGVFVCGQITAASVDELAKAGFKAIICNRPDNEEANQPAFREIEECANKYGIKCYYIPVTPPHIEENSIKHMAEALKSCEYPLLAYCKSGRRAQTLYQLAKK